MNKKNIAYLLIASVVIGGGIYGIYAYMKKKKGGSNQIDDLSTTPNTTTNNSARVEQRLLQKEEKDPTIVALDKIEQMKSMQDKIRWDKSRVDKMQ